MNIHFVCTGNTYRSRIAEAYLKSKQLPNIEVSSSGTGAEKNLSGTITSYTKDILEKEGILSYAKKTWTQTTKAELARQDLIIFMAKAQLDYCTNFLGFLPKKYEVWNVKDVNDVLPESKQNEKSISEFAKENYMVIIEKVDELETRIKNDL